MFLSGRGRGLATLERFSQLATVEIRLVARRRGVEVASRFLLRGSCDLPLVGLRVCSVSEVGMTQGCGLYLAVLVFGVSSLFDLDGFLKLWAGNLILNFCKLDSLFCH